MKATLVSFLPCLLQAEELLASKNLDKEYAAIHGLPEFCKAACNLALGEGNAWVQEGLVSASDITQLNLTWLVAAHSARSLPVFHHQKFYKNSGWIIMH